MTDQAQSRVVSDPQNAFLDMLARGSAAAAETAPASSPPAPAGTDPDMVYVEPTESWEDQPREPADLMDLGADAQAQGHAMGLASIANRLGSLVSDLDTLGYDDQASGLLALIEWAVQEHNRIMGELEQRGVQRRGGE